MDGCSPEDGRVQRLDEWDARRSTLCPGCRSRGAGGPQAPVRPGRGGARSMKAWRRLVPWAHLASRARRRSPCAGVRVPRRRQANWYAGARRGSQNSATVLWDAPNEGRWGPSKHKAWTLLVFFGRRAWHGLGGRQRAHGHLCQIRFPAGRRGVSAHSAVAVGHRVDSARLAPTQRRDLARSGHHDSSP